MCWRTQTISKIGSLRVFFVFFLKIFYFVTEAKWINGEIFTQNISSVSATHFSIAVFYLWRAALWQKWIVIIIIDSGFRDNLKNIKRSRFFSTVCFLCEFIDLLEVVAARRQE